MLLPHHPAFLDALRTPGVDDPLRVLVSGCLAGLHCGTDGSDNGLGQAVGWLLKLPIVRVVPFCPEDHVLGTPRSTPDLDDGDGEDVLAGRARVIDEHGADLTEAMVRGAQAMVEVAVRERVELCVLTDMSAACGSDVVSLGTRHAPRLGLGERRYQRGVGVATALLLRHGLPIVSQRDFFTLGRLRARLDPTHVVDAGAVDHRDHPWTRTHSPGPHPRA